MEKEQVIQYDEATQLINKVTDWKYIGEKKYVGSIGLVNIIISSSGDSGGLHSPDRRRWGVGCYIWDKLLYADGSGVDDANPSHPSSFEKLFEQVEEKYKKYQRANQDIINHTLIMLRILGKRE